MHVRGSLVGSPAYGSSQVAICALGSPWEKLVKVSPITLRSSMQQEVRLESSKCPQSLNSDYLAGNSVHWVYAHLYDHDPELEVYARGNAQLQVLGEGTKASVSVYIRRPSKSSGGAQRCQSRTIPFHRYPEPDVTTPISSIVSDMRQWYRCWRGCVRRCMRRWKIREGRKRDTHRAGFVHSEPCPNCRSLQQSGCQFRMSI